MKAIAVRDGLYEGARIRKGQEFEFDTTKYKTKSKKPWFVPADSVKVVQPPKDAPKTLKELGARGGKSFVDVMKDVAAFAVGPKIVDKAGNDLAQ